MSEDPPDKAVVVSVLNLAVTTSLAVATTSLTDGTTPSTGEAWTAILAVTPSWTVSGPATTLT